MASTQFDPQNLSPRDIYLKMVSVITPRPIAWVSTISNAGVHNLAPFSFFNGVAANPPSVVFSPVNRRDGSKKDTILNIQENGEFVINTVSQQTAQAMNQSAADYDASVSEIKAIGLTPLESTTIKPYRIKEAAVHLECKLIQIVNIGQGPLAANLVIGEILMMHINDQILDQNQNVIPEKLDNIGRMGGSDYATTRDTFQIPRIINPEK